MLIIMVLIAVCGFEISYSQSFPDQMSIEIIPGDYGNPSEITTFTEGEKPYTNSATEWESVASEFKGFQFFSSNSNNTYRGKIVPSATGEIYLVASGTLTIAGWTKTTYTATYKLSTSPTTLYIFKKNVNLGDTIDLPTNSNWAGLSPLAQAITIKDIDTEVLTLVKSSPSEAEVCYYNLQKGIKLYFNKEIEFGTGELLLNKKLIPLNDCLIDNSIVSVPIELEGSPTTNKDYTFTASAGCFLSKNDPVLSQSRAISLNFKTSKRVAYPSDYSAQTDILYKRVNSSNTRMDIYYPTNPNKPAPVIIRFHGGGWKSGFKEDYTNFDLYFDQGYALANVEYRLTEEAKAPAAVEDARAAMIYLLHHAEEYNIDRQKIIFLGGSAGGHLALTAGYLQNNRMYDNDIEPYIDDIKVMAVIDKYGITKLDDLMSYSSLVEWLGDSINNQEFIKSLSPFYLVNANTPPTYIVHGDSDPTVPYNQSVSLQEILQKFGIKNKFTTIPGGGHGGFSSTYNTQINNEVIQFINDVIEEQETKSELNSINKNNQSFTIENGKITILSDKITKAVLYDNAGKQLLYSSQNSFSPIQQGFYILKLQIEDITTVYKVFIK